jgi:hypothetical protein
MGEFESAHEQQEVARCNACERNFSRQWRSDAQHCAMWEVELGVQCSSRTRHPLHCNASAFVLHVATIISADLPVSGLCGGPKPRSFVGSISASARLALRLRTHARTSPSLQARPAGDRGVHSGTEVSTASAHSEIRGLVRQLFDRREQVKRVPKGSHVQNRPRTCSVL